MLVLDASQAAGHETINLSEFPCTVLCAPGHKALFGLQGSGFAIFCNGIWRGSFLEGGSGGDSLSTDMPAVFPEGYTSMDEKLHPFRSGVFKIALRAKVPVVVCTVQNTNKVFGLLEKSRASKNKKTTLTIIC